MQRESVDQNKLKAQNLHLVKQKKILQVSYNCEIFKFNHNNLTYKKGLKRKREKQFIIDTKKLLLSNKCTIKMFSKIEVFKNLCNHTSILHGFRFGLKTNPIVADLIRNSDLPFFQTVQKIDKFGPTSFTSYLKKFAVNNNISCNNNIYDFKEFLQTVMTQNFKNYSSYKVDYSCLYCPRKLSEQSLFFDLKPYGSDFSKIFDQLGNNFNEPCWCFFMQKNVKLNKFIFFDTFNPLKHENVTIDKIQTSSSKSYGTYKLLFIVHSALPVQPIGHAVCINYTQDGRMLMMDDGGTSKYLQKKFKLDPVIMCYFRSNIGLQIKHETS